VNPDFAVTLNGRTSFVLGNQIRSAADDLQLRVSRLDGEKRYSLILWQVPEDKSFDRIDTRKYPLVYLQTAGSYMGEMIAEVREVDGDQFVQFALGRPGQTCDVGHEPDRVVVWNGCETHVCANEVLTGEEVAGMLLAYLHTNAPPATATRRRLDLGKP
jgi:hypothetical protein